ncbi:hypothetical protein [Oceanibaculum indicum]|uniref:Uncharacterized protein n=1 Tax=Oceanibaculum indicum TaxID=526216 RepID=A0A420WPI1_9PROT|nr:hypothetical protein [Oceanibaculum indicum]RKQ72948.1 hypothetical protein BCL74_0718 [Oceanibaculum indicum]
MPTTDSPEALVLDLVEWVALAPRPYGEAIEAWRTSCPRLTVWEDAADQGLVRRIKSDTGENLLAATEQGLLLLKAKRGDWPER